MKSPSQAACLRCLLEQIPLLVVPTEQHFVFCIADCVPDQMLIQFGWRKVQPLGEAGEVLPSLRHFLIPLSHA